MKKTPFYRMIRQVWRWKSLFTAMKKICLPFFIAEALTGKEGGTDPRWCSARRDSSALSGVVAMVSYYLIIAIRSANFRLQLP